MPEQKRCINETLEAQIVSGGRKNETQTARRSPGWAKTVIFYVADICSDCRILRVAEDGRATEPRALTGSVIVSKVWVGRPVRKSSY